MDRAAVTWSNGIWDIGSLENMGRDVIPTLYDANASGYTGYYQSGIGYGNNLYMRGIYESDINTVYPIDNIPSGNIWSPILEAGYFYIDQNEYYFYISKYSTTVTPTAGKLELGEYTDKYPQGPVVVTTYNSNEFTTKDPFAKTYEPTPSGVATRTSNKYRKVTNLTGRKDWEVDSSGFLIPYIYNWENMTFTIGASGNNDTVPSGWYRYVNAYPSGTPLTFEMECAASGWGKINYVDLNPYNTYESYNTFLVITPSGITLPYLKTYDAEISYLNRCIPTGTGVLDLICAVKDKWGAPISGIDVLWDDNAAGGALNPNKSTTIWDGTTHTRYIMNTSSSAGITISVTVDGTTDSIWMPVGKVS